MQYDIQSLITVPPFVREKLIYCIHRDLNAHIADDQEMVLWAEWGEYRKKALAYCIYHPTTDRYYRFLIEVSDKEQPGFIKANVFPYRSNHLYWKMAEGAYTCREIPTLTKYQEYQHQKGNSYDQLHDARSIRLPRG